MKSLEEKKQRIIDEIIDVLMICIDDMQSSDEKKAKNADIRFNALAQGLYNFIKFY